MNVDLVVSNSDEIGIISDTPFDKEVEAIQLDQGSSMVILGLAKGKEAKLMNVPIGITMLQYILDNDRCHIAIIKNGQVIDTKQVPVFVTNPVPEVFEPYHIEPRPASISLIAINDFIKRAKSGQPLHRDNLGDEQSLHQISKQLSAVTLQLAPHLVKALKNEQSLALSQKLQPNAPAPKTPGLGLSSRSPTPPKQTTTKGDETIH